MQPDSPWGTPDEVLANVSFLVESAIVRRVWLFPIDDLDRSMTCLQIDDLPVDPDPEEVQRFAEVIGQVAQYTGAVAVAVVWERPGGPGLRTQEADWAAGLAATDAPIRAQLLAHDGGCRLLDPAFEAVVA